MKKIVALLAAVPMLLSAQMQPVERPHFVRATGEVVIRAKPDRAEVNIGVLTQANTAQRAASQNASQTTEVVSAIKEALGSGGEVKTLGYSVSPQIDYSHGKARVAGYQASNTVTVIVDELPRLARVIDAATNTGANNVNGISFTLRDDASVRERALAEAAAKARANAEALAKALHVEVMDVLEAEPSTPSNLRPYLASMAQTVTVGNQPVPTPVQVGDLDIRATVTVTLEVR